MRLDKLNIPTFSIIKIIEEDLNKKPSVSGANTQVYFSSRMNRLFSNASKEAQGLKDDFIWSKAYTPGFIDRY